ncbi:MAG: beta-ketoacyl-[acyl-carrier-protein] synthase family protein [Thermoanaerobaculales bacterium]
MSTNRRVVVTGIGAVSAFGWGVGSLQAGMQSGKTAIGDAKDFDTARHRTHVAGEVPAAPKEIQSSIHDWARLSRADRFAVAAAEEALRHADLAVQGPHCGVYWGGSTAGMLECEEYIARVLNVRPGSPHLRLLGSQQLNGPGDAVARALGVAGPVQNFSSACASGGLAIGAAVDAVQIGEVETAIAGGADSLCQLTYGGFNSLRSVDGYPCRPFRADRAGLSLGEGAGVLVLETPDHAEKRGGHPLAEVRGFGASCDAHHMTAPHPEGDGILAAMEDALSAAGLEPSELGFINSHGTGTPHNDSAEARAYSRLLGNCRAEVPLTATKALVGHVLGAAGALEAVATVIALVEAVIHPTPGKEAADPDLGVDLVVGKERPLEDKMIGISTNLAFGGANAALVLEAWVEAR